MTYATPEAFKQALEARIRSAARTRAGGIARMRQMLVFDRFLARAFAELGDDVIVKGGAVLELRLDRARMTRDIDLRVAGSPDTLIARLLRAASLHLDDFFLFEVHPDREHPKIEGDGMIYDGRRFRAQARVAGKIYGDPFGVDVGFGDVLTEPPETLDGTDFFSFANVPRARYRVYPRESHVAEKLHAYTLPRKRPNSRVKDLPDIALLAQNGPFDAASLRRALDATFSFRRTHPLPARVPDPPNEWIAPFRDLADADDLPWPDSRRSRRRREHSSIPSSPGATAAGNQQGARGRDAREFACERR